MGDDALDQLLEVLGHAAVAAEMGEGPLHHPSTRLNGEADLIGRGANDRHPPAEGGFDPILELALVGAIGPQLLDARERLVGTHQQIEATIPILLVGGMDVDAQDQAETVHQQVPLAAQDLFFPRRSLARRQPRWS